MSILLFIIIILLKCFFNPIHRCNQIISLILSDVYKTSVIFKISDIFEYKSCESGSVLRRGCNLCRCVSDIGYACDKEECPPDQPTGIYINKYYKNVYSKRLKSVITV